jgi:hypothetical protein
VLSAGPHRTVKEIAAVARQRLGGLWAQAVYGIIIVLARAQFGGGSSQRGVGPV